MRPSRYKSSGRGRLTLLKRIRNSKQVRTVGVQCTKLQNLSNSVRARATIVETPLDRSNDISMVVIIAFQDSTENA